jgi:hypothetical protein
MTTTTRDHRDHFVAWALASACALALALVSVAPAGAATTEFGGGTLDWGVKQSFRNYVGNMVSDGTITASEGAEKIADDRISFDVLGGSYDDEGGTGELTVGGAVRFQGHDGALDLTLRNLCVSLNGSSGVMYADVITRDFDTQTTDHRYGVDLVDLASVPLPPAVAGDDWTWASIPTTLAPGGVFAFDGVVSYPAGTEFDPLAPLVATAGPPQSRPDGTPCRGVDPGGNGDGGDGDNGGGGAGNGGGGGTGGDNGGGGTPVPQPNPGSRAAPWSVKARKGAVLVRRKRVATVARLRCGPARCAISVPKAVKVKIAGKRYRVAVRAPKRLAAKRRAKLRVKLTRAARKALAGRRAKVKIKVVVGADGRRTAKTIRVTLRAGRLSNG